MSGLSTANLSYAIKQFLIEEHNCNGKLVANSFRFALEQALWEYKQLSRLDKDGGEKALKFIEEFIKELPEEIEGGLIV